LKKEKARCFKNTWLFYRNALIKTF